MDTQKIIEGVLASLMTNTRFLATTDADCKIRLQEIPKDAFIFSQEKLHELIRDSGADFNTHQLTHIISACAEHLSERTGTKRTSSNQQTQITYRK